MPTIATICHIMKDGRVLLIKKAEGLFGAGKWNGPGGKLMAGEDPLDCAVREVQEETGLRATNPYYHGSLQFYFGEKEDADWLVHVFSASSFEGEEREGGEGALAWFPLGSLPYDEMWEDDRHWLPYVLTGKKFSAKFYFDRDAKKLIHFQLREAQ